jgi:hypothetical protein
MIDGGWWWMVSSDCEGLRDAYRPVLVRSGRVVIIRLPVR